MNWQTIFILAAIGSVFGFGRDFVAALRARRKRITVEQDRAIREPIEVHAEILEATKKAVVLQAAVMAELRNSLEREQAKNLNLTDRLEASIRREHALILRFAPTLPLEGES